MSFKKPYLGLLPPRLSLKSLLGSQRGFGSLLLGPGFECGMVEPVFKFRHGDSCWEWLKSLTAGPPRQALARGNGTGWLFGAGSWEAPCKRDEMIYLPKPGGTCSHAL